MIPKYFQKYCDYYLSHYTVTKKKFENILKRKISKDFFQKKISIEEKKAFLDNIFDVINYFDKLGVFNENLFIDNKINYFIKKGFSLKKIRIHLLKNYFDEKLINSKINLLDNDKNLKNTLMNNYLIKCRIVNEKSLISIDEGEFNKLLKKFINQGFKYNESLAFLKKNITTNE